jgi:hypothetical protein
MRKSGLCVPKNNSCLMFTLRHVKYEDNRLPLQLSTAFQPRSHATRLTYRSISQDSKKKKSSFVFYPLARANINYVLTILDTSDHFSFIYRSMVSSELTEKYFMDNYKIVALKMNIPKKS